MTNVTNIMDGEPDPMEFLKSSRGTYIMAKALHLAIKYENSLPEYQRAVSDRDDMLFILNGCFKGLAERFRRRDLEDIELTEKRQDEETHEP